MDTKQLGEAFLKEQGCELLNWRILFTDKEIARGIDTLAERLNQHYDNAQKPLILVGILKGVYVFLADLSRRLTIPHSVYFVEVSSYSGQERGQVQFASTIVPSKLRGRNVLLLDELFDHGDTMTRTKQALLDNAELELKPEDIVTCTLFIKDSGTALPPPDFVGMPMLPALWLVGSGLDDNGEKRGWPHLFACPKAEGIPTVPEDAIFESDEAYFRLRQQLQSVPETVRAEMLAAFARQNGIANFAMGSAHSEQLAEALRKLHPDWLIDYNDRYVFFE
jgi:hypoxanthine phosphoribosyltransferase